MKKANFIFTFLFCFPNICYLQFHPYNSHFNQLDSIQCPHDTSITIQQPRHWFIYQTINNKWDGPVDSSVCINVINLGFLENGIDLGMINMEKPLFIRNIGLNTWPISLNPNEGYAARGQLGLASSLQPDISTNCQNSICSGLIIGIEIPDSIFTSKAIRYYYDVPNSTNPSSSSFETCIPTENFDQNRLIEFYYKNKIRQSTVRS